jgi:hypothetical protein
MIYDIDQSINSGNALILLYTKPCNSDIVLVQSKYLKSNNISISYRRRGTGGLIPQAMITKINMQSGLPAIAHPDFTRSLITCFTGNMRAIICSSRGVTLFLRTRRAGRVSIACFRGARYSTVPSDCINETFSLPIGNNGSIDLEYEFSAYV